jgi:hypothetical protein
MATMMGRSTIFAGNVIPESHLEADALLTANISFLSSLLTADVPIHSVHNTTATPSVDRETLN